MTQRATLAFALLSALLLSGCMGVDGSTRPNSEVASSSVSETTSMEAGFSSDQAKPSGTGPGEYLVFEFPDGVRGGFGKIQGVGEWPAYGAYGLPLPADYWVNFASLFKNCGAQDPWFERRWSHRVMAVVDHSPRNDEIVECVRQSVNMHFNVGTGAADPDDPLSLMRLPDRSRNARP